MAAAESARRGYGGKKGPVLRGGSGLRAGGKQGDDPKDDLRSEKEKENAAPRAGNLLAYSCGKILGELNNKGKNAG